MSKHDITAIGQAIYRDEMNAKIADMESLLGWARDAAKALDAKPWLDQETRYGTVTFTCLFCNASKKTPDIYHASDCRMRTLEDLSRTIPKELLE